MTNRLLALTFLALVGMAGWSGSAHAQITEDLGISSEHYIVVDADTGEVLAEKNADDRVAIASLTKVFTTIEALERGDLDQLITTKESDLYDSSSTLMGFGPGETFTLRDLLYGMMLPSGNDAAHAIARAIGETPGASDQDAYENFIAMMNERVEKMGLENTHFMNPHGWGVEGHYSSARDVATFMMYAMKNETFREIIATDAYTTSLGGYVVSNTNRLLNGYSGLIGGKTGYDEDSGYCLIEAAKRGGTTMVSVTLDGIAPDIWYQDNVILLDTAFNARQQRVSAGLPIEGRVLSYVDPNPQPVAEAADAGQPADAPSSDSAGQVADTSSAGTVGQIQIPAPSNPAIVESSTDSPSSSSGAEVTADNSSSGSATSPSILGVLAVAVLIALVLGVKAIAPRLLGRQNPQTTQESR